MRNWLVVLFVFVLTAVSFAQIPTSSHVVMVVEQNHSYSSVIGNSAMPYLNSLASKYGLATHYYANTHPAIGNYFELTTGSVLTNDNTATPSNLPVTADNIVDQMMVAGKTWKSYAEDLPYAGYTGGDTGNYAVRNNPFAYFADVQNSSTQKMNLVPFSQFATDLAGNQLPDFSYIVPNRMNDGANGSLQQSDTWLKQNIAPLLADSNFQKDGLLIITFEESAKTDTAHGGGHVATLVIGPNVIPAYKSTTLYQHQSLLRTVLSAMGATSFPGAAATAPLMSEFFTAPVSATSKAATPNATAAATAVGVTITSPTSGATVSSPVNFVASAYSGSTTYPITSMRLYVDSVSKYTVSAASLNTSVALSTGAHNVTVVAWDKSGKSYSSRISITVGATTSAGSVTVTSPASGATVGSPVQFVASAQAPSGRTITAMRIYVDSVSAYLVNAASINTSLAIASGAHNVTVQAWDNAGTVYKSSRSITATSSAPGSLTSNVSSLNFGSVAVGSSASRTVTLTASASSVTISQMSTIPGFTVSGISLPLTIPAGQSASFTVKFTPTTAATVSGSLSLLSSASNSTLSIGVIGTGTSSTATVHSVTLTWTASSSSGVSGYNVYRSTTSGISYAKLTSSQVTGTSYTDANVSAGATYYYVVTAVGASGAESGYSSQVSAIIPTP
ncbi:MAG TPA: alkaline phosphatase family protein [Candidatus Saccharimonadales bacterium]|nr:alkaline phosphatase family protein [Candidatus Saccharimonadales bacterium]